MRIVLDTNVLVSGLLRPHGPPGAILRMLSAGHVRICYDARILAEYREVLLRPLFPFDVERVDALLDEMRAAGLLVASRPLETPLPDPDDEPFLEVGLAGGAECLVTGNRRHYPRRAAGGMPILSPAEFLDLCRRRR